MTAQDWVIIIGAVGANLCAIIAAVAVLLSKFQEKTDALNIRLKENTRLTAENHHLMNSQKEAADTYQRQLIDALSEHRINIPRDESIKEPKKSK